MSVADLGDLRREVARSPLVDAGGFAVVRLLDPHALGRLQEEAWSARPTAVTCREPAPMGDGEQRGHADRWMAMGAGGPTLDAFLVAPAILGLLRELTGVAWQPLGPRGVFSYYESAGHYLGIHRDVRRCDLAVITCLWDTGGPGGDLVLYPGASCRPLADVRADPREGAHRVRLAVGESAVLLGGVIPHHVTPVGTCHVRVVAPLCYSLAGAG